jgi:hypothetical protein
LRERNPIGYARAVTFGTRDGFLRDIPQGPVAQIMPGPRLVIEFVNHPPTCDVAYLSPDTLWPPNHQMVDLEVMGLTDPDGDDFTWVIGGVKQDEPLDGLGDGDTSPDGYGIGTQSPRVRAERDATGNGRVYHVELVATDEYGAGCWNILQVTVPTNQGRRGTAIDDGPLYNSEFPDVWHP